MSDELVRGRVEELKRQRDELVSQANLALAKITGAIEALESLVQEEEPEEQSE